MDTQPAGFLGFWAMSGYAVYVWGSFGAALAVFVWNWLAPRWRRRQILQMAVEE